MKSLTQFYNAPLVWKQPHLMDPVFELKSSEEVLGILRFKNSFGSRAFGTLSEGEWTFKRQGFTHTFVSVRKEGEDTNLAIFRNNTWSGGGTLEFPDGRRYMANSNYWHARFEFSNEAGEPIIRFTNVGNFKMQSQLEIISPVATVGEIPWIILLGWYLTVMNNRDGEVIASIF